MNGMEQTSCFDKSNGIQYGRLGMPLIDTVHCCRAEDLLCALPDDSIDLIATDPPYYKVKPDAWDRQWDTAAEFTAWIGQLCEQWRRVLKPNGSLYVFASPQLAWGVEGEIRKQLSILNQIVWFKDEGIKGWSRQAGKETLRAFFPQTERIIFAEHYGSDNMAKGESTYAAACDELRGFVFEPLRAYLEGERLKAGVSFEEVRQMVGCASDSGLPSHWFTRSQWSLPTAENYAKLQEGFNADDRAEYLRREYEYLRREYEYLRRPFNVSPDVPYTDVWTFATVGAYPGKHPAEKPLPLMEHIIKASSKPGAIVLDCFAGSGTTLRAAQTYNRHYIGCDMNAAYVAIAQQRLEPRFGGYVVANATAAPLDDLPLFGGITKEQQQ